MMALFPGQGSQSVGMTRELLGLFPQMAALFEEVEDTLKLPIRRLCQDGPESDLQATAVLQPCLMAVSRAYFEVLKREVGFSPSLAAGHSLGEYSALICLGALDIASGARLLRTRGVAMQEAVPMGQGGMLAVLGLTDLEGLIKACRATIALCSPGAVLEVANLNSPSQWILSGHGECLERFPKTLAESGLRAVCKRLPVSAPFHCSLMKPAAEVMAQALASQKLSPPECAILSNVTAQAPETPEEHKALLVQQICAPVRWLQSMQEALLRGEATFVEVGPGRVLSGLMAKIAEPQHKLRILSCAPSLKELLKELSV